jgi:Lrp/AsnC family leucine-responsive transcriptional regulator
VGLTTTPCKERVKRLEREGYITGYHAQLNPEKLGRGLVVFVQISLQRTAGDAFKEFTEAVRDIPAIEECHLVAGNFDYLIKARVRDMNEYREFLGSSLMQLPGVQESTSYPVMEVVLG